MFSILTPTYNRAKELPRVFESLLSQTYTDFEWIISDDGSTDETATLIEEWQHKKPHFKITHHVLAKNMGKPFAVNEGLDLCKHTYTLIADSDDTFSESTLADLKIIWDGIENTVNPKKIGAVWTLVQDEEGNLVGEPWPKDFWQVSFEDRVLNRKRPIKGEKWHCWRTEILQNYKLYANVNSSYIGEGATWNRINKDFDFLCVNIVHRNYFYTDNGIINQNNSRLKLEKRNYYSSFFTLRDTPLLDILTKKFYRKVAFNYVKASLFYSDNDYKLRGFKVVVAWLSFLLSLPVKLITRILPSK